MKFRGQNFSPDVYLGKEVDNFDKGEFEQAYCDYVRTLGIKDKKLKCTTDLCKKLHPYLGKRNWRWTMISTKDVKWATDIKPRGLYNHLRNFLNNDKMLNQAFKLYDEEKEERLQLMLAQQNTEQPTPYAADDERYESPAKTQRPTPGAEFDSTTKMKELTQIPEDCFLTPSPDHSPPKMPVSPISFNTSNENQFEKLRLLYDDAERKIEAAHAAVAKYESKRDSIYFLQGFKNSNVPTFGR